MTRDTNYVTPQKASAAKTSTPVRTKFSVDGNWLNKLDTRLANYLIDHDNTGVH